MPVSLEKSLICLWRYLIEVSVVRDVTERHQVQEVINHLAYYDDLTGLPN